MIAFQRLDPQQKDELLHLFSQTGRVSCEYSFVNLFLWGRQHGAILDGYLCFFSHFRGKSIYLFPVGTGPLKPVIDALRSDASQRGIPLRLYGLSPEDCRTMESLYPGLCHFRSDRDGADYLYTIDHLADLKGRNYQQKRNHINRFLDACPNWRTEEIRRENQAQCLELARKWYLAHREQDPENDDQLEQLALERAFRHYDDLGLMGLILYSDETPVAFTVGSFLTDTVVDVHFEKAESEIPGAYTMINREFARYIRSRFPQVTHLDREDDMGLPGLRKAKLSYHPDILVEKYRCVLLEEPNVP